MRKVLKIPLVILMALTMITTCLVPTFSAAGTEVKGITVAQALGMDGGTYMEWLQSHESDSYYLGTPYGDGDYRNPKGDCSGAYGYSDTKGHAAMNCTGFVWHVLTKATKASGGKTSIIPAMSGWVTFYRNYNISRRYFSSKSEMLNSGYLEKGDIIWMFQNGSEGTVSDYNHVGIYWGDGKSDVFWHSLDLNSNLTGNIQSTVVPKKNNNVLYVVIKVGAKQRGYIKVIKSSSDSSITSGNSSYSFANIEYYVSKSKTDFDVTGSNYLGYIKLNAAGEGHSKDGSRETLRKLSPGTYYIKEGYVPASSSYKKNDTVYTVTVTANHTITKPVVLRPSDEPKTCYGKIIKASTKPELTDNNPEYSMEGIRYSFSKSKTDFDPNGSNYIGYVALDEDGVGYTANGSRATLRKLVPGTYYVKESVIPAGCKYKMDNTVYTMTFTFSNDENNLKVLNVKDEPEGSSSAKIIKKSSLPEITDGNPLYAFKGAEFSVYKSRSDAEQKTNPYTTVTTDENGIALISDIELGIYYIRETKAPVNYELSNEIKELKVETAQDEAYEVEFEDKPIVADLTVLLQKKNAATGETANQKMSDAEYTVRYYSDNLDEETVNESVPVRTWVFITDDKNMCLYDLDHLKSGDGLYTDGAGNFVLPLGTIAIHETAAPDGFYLDENVYIRQINQAEALNITQYNIPISYENEIHPVDLSGEKTWDDDNDRDGKRPKSITLELYRDDELIDSATVTAEDNWKYEFTDLPKGYADLSLDDHFYFYRYEVKEGDVQYYESESSGVEADPEDGNHLICDFINHYTPERTKVDGTKSWDDYENSFGYRPETIKVILNRDGVKYKEVTTSKAENWSYEFKNLYKYHDGGKKYVYTVTEEPVPGYVLLVDGYNMKNTLQVGSVTLNKTDGNADPIQGVSFKLYTDSGKPVASVESNHGYRFFKLTDNEDEAVYITNSNGQIEVTDLPIGDYYFVEENTSAGFIKFEDKIPFTIDGESEETLHASVDVENAKAIMPQTGGIGNGIFGFASVMLTVLAAILLCNLPKKSNKKG